MDNKTYLDLLAKQQQCMTPEMLDAIKSQAKLHSICEAKRNLFYELEDKYRGIFTEGVNLLFEQHPELRDKLPAKETRSEQIRAIAEEIMNPADSGCKNIAQLMKTIPQLVEAEKMNVDIGKACFEYFVALSNANQHNPNNHAYQADRDNHANQCNPNNDEYRGSKEDHSKQK